LRIGLDMLGIQAAGGAGSPAARYTRLLVSALLDHDRDHEFILYGHDEYPRPAIPTGRRSRFFALALDRGRDESLPSGRLEWLAGSNPDRLDWLVVLDPFEPALGFGPPARPLGGLKLAAVVADLTPFLLPERDLGEPELAYRAYRALGRLRHYAAILTPSEAARDDALALLQLPPGRVHAIGNAVDRGRFLPVGPGTIRPASREMLDAYGIRGAFVLVDAGQPGQKNVERTIDAFGRIPEAIRRETQLVFFGPVPDATIERVRPAADGPTGDAPIFTGLISEGTFSTLLHHCAVFAHPALHDGSGQSILAALQCGASVVAADHSAQAELVGEAGLLTDPADPIALADRIGRLLDDPGLARSLGRMAVARSGRFRVEDAAARALDALERLAGPRPSPRHRVDRAHRTRPRIAFFSPLPPRISGIADYAVRLIDELKATYTIDLYHDAGYLPDLGLNAREFATYDGRLFDRNHAVLNYHAIVYQMGNSLDYHGYLYDVMLRHPGVVTLHDFFLSVYPYRGTRNGGEVRAAFRREIRHFCPDRADEFLPHVEDWCEEEGGLAAACARRGLYLNRRVFEGALGVVVHSPWCLDQVRAWMPEHADRTTVIPHGASPTSCTPEARAEIRDRFGLARDALVVSSFGFVHPDKLIDEALDAFRPVAEADASACFVCVGAECDGGSARWWAEDLGLSDRVRFLGRRPADAFADLIAATDLGINLRRPPTNGETSGALLNLLAAGVPTIVTDVATFADYPDHVVRKVRWDDHGPEALRQAVGILARDQPAREAIGRAARAHVRERHAWPRSAARYVNLIESCAAARRGDGQGGAGRVSRPHPSVPTKEHT
jgi:glycosyltransferase involved in cell wall biosynthesis